MKTERKRKEPLTPEQAKQKAADWLQTKTTTRNGHWCVADETKRSFLFVNGTTYSEVQCAFFVRYGRWFDSATHEYAQSPLCPEKRCLQHRLLRRHDVPRIEDATNDEKHYVKNYVAARAKVDADCLKWQGNVDKTGFAPCTRHFGCVSVHRLSCILNHDKSLSADQIVLHCRHGHSCIAPGHLRVVSNKEKHAAIKCVRKMKMGEQHYKAKLTEVQVRAIRATKGQGTQQDRADRFGVCREAVSQIDLCRIWKHLWSDKEKEEAAKHKTHRPPLPPEKIEAIAASRDEGITQKERGDIFGVTQGQVSEIDRGKRHTLSAAELKEKAKPGYYEEMRLRIRSRCKLERASKIKQDDCWMWQGRRNKKGYGEISFYHRNALAHIISWLVNSKELYEEVPDNKDGHPQQVRHLCSIKLCCNPEHLDIGTAKDDARDRREAGNQAEGADHWLATFTEQQIRDIRASTLTQKELADLYGVSSSTINEIIHRKTYQNVV